MHIYGWHLEFQPLEALSSFVKYHSKKKFLLVQREQRCVGGLYAHVYSFCWFLGTHERFQRTQTKECRQSQTKLVTNCLKCLLVLLSTAAYLETTLGLLLSKGRPIDVRKCNAMHYFLDSASNKKWIKLIFTSSKKVISFLGI